MFISASVVRYAGYILVVLLAGCSSKPSSISLAVVDDLSLVQVLKGDDVHVGSTVRWGGVITEVENKPDRTWVFLVARPLKNNDKPIVDGDSDGRFIASFEGFIDPEVYTSGRPLTVVGTIDGSNVRAIGEYDYRFPIVSVRDSHLWAEPDNSRVYYPPPPYWYYDMHYYRPYPYPHHRW